MISIKPIHYGSPAYLETLELRNRVMRLPLGLNIHDEDFSFEQNCVLYAAFDGEQVIGMGSMSREGDTCNPEPGSGPSAARSPGRRCPGTGCRPYLSGCPGHSPALL